MSDDAERQAALEPGHKVDHFRILRRVGSGGMGEVYLARDTRLGRRVALKVIRARRMGSSEMVRRFLAEARITARFSHPHIVTIHAVGVHQGSPYLALEYLEGQSLSQRLREERPGFLESLRIALAIAKALEEAHAARVLHRDLKPGNVLIPKDGRIRVVDFGISKVLADDLPTPGKERPSSDEPGASEQPSRSTDPRPSTPASPGPERRRGAVDAESAAVSLDRSAIENVYKSRGKGLGGTPTYMAPEQWAQEAGTPATDIWALGLILHQLFAGKHPYHGAELHQLCLLVCGADPVPSLDGRDLPAELVTLADQCLQKDPEKRPTAEAVVRGLDELLHKRRGRRQVEKHPFRGLRAFEERHADLFFGRDDEVMEFLERLREEPVLPVVGASGAGKSSFVQAGIIPRLREQGPWQVVQLRPGDHPFQTLASVLATEGTTAKSMEETSTGPTVRERFSGASDPQRASQTGPAKPPRRLPEEEQHLAAQLAESPATLNLTLHRIAEQTAGRVLLFVDQLEELYTLVEDAPTRQRFMQALCAAADDRLGPVRVIFTVREDFLSRLAEGPEARAALSHVTVMRSPGAEALRDILERPLDATEYSYQDPELVDDLIRDVREEPACLPLLAFAAQTLWARRDKQRKLLVRQAYESMGGVGGALAEHADGVLQGLSDSQVKLAREVLLRLVTAEGTRRVVSRRAVLEGLGEESAEVLRHLTQARLISVRKGREASQGSAQLELVHESLIERWSQLSRWIDEGREDLSFLGEVGQAAELWDKRGRPAAEVWHGEALTEAERKARRCQSVPRLVQEFLAEGARQAQRRTRRRRILWATAMAMLAVITLAAVGVSFVVSKKERFAQTQWRTAQQHRAEAQLAGARAALLRGEPLEGRARIRLALQTNDSRLARALWWQLSKVALLWKKELGADLQTVAFSPDGRTVAAGCMNSAVYLFDTETRTMRVLRGHRDQVLEVAFSADGARLASAGQDNEIRIWELPSGQSRSVRSVKGGGIGLAFSPDGKLLAVGGTDKKVRLWDINRRRTHAVLHGHTGGVYTVQFSPDGALLASGARDGSVRLWDVKTARQRAVLQAQGAMVLSVSFSADGALLASGSYDKTVRIWDVKKARPRVVLQGHRAGVNGVSFSPDGKLLASASTDKSVRLWEVGTGQQRALLRGHQGGVNGVMFSPDGSRLVSASEDSTVRLWDARNIRQQPPPRGHESGVRGLAFSPDGRRLASGAVDRTVRLWDVKSGRQEAVLRGHQAAIFGVAMSPDGALLASASTDKSVRLWDVEQARQRAVLQGHVGSVFSVAFSPDGSQLASGGGDRTVRIWDLGNFGQRAVLRGHSSGVFGVAYHPSGSRLASGSWDQTVRLWDLRNNKQSAVLKDHEGPVFGASFSLDGALLATGAMDSTLRIWDIRRPRVRRRVVKRFEGRVHWLEFHPLGRRVGVPTSDATARIWDLRTQEQIVLRGHRAEVNTFRFSPDGRLAATTSDDGTVRLWEADTGDPVWRAPLLRPRRLELLTHEGWIRLGDRREPVGQQASARWRTAVEKTARVAAQSPDGRLLCVGTHRGTLQIWDLISDRLLSSTAVPRLTQVAALPRGCASLGQGIARHHDPAGETRTLHKQATALAWQPKAEELLIAAGRKIWVHGAAGKARTNYPTDVGVTAVGRAGPWIVVGFKDGNLELIPTRAGTARPRFSFEGVPPSPVVSIIPGPLGTVVAGYANGLLGMWSLANGMRLEHGRMHGPVVHLVINGSKLYAVSELGQHTIWDLGLFHLPYCDLLRQVWRAVPLVWKAGLPVLRAPPHDHRCRKPSVDRRR